MANTKKARSEKKTTMSFSIKTRHSEDFNDICSRKGLVKSAILEGFVIKFNKQSLGYEN